MMCKSSHAKQLVTSHSVQVFTCKTTLMNLATEQSMESFQLTGNNGWHSQHKHSAEVQCKTAMKESAINEQQEKPKHEHGALFTHPSNKVAQRNAKQQCFSV